MAKSNMSSLTRRLQRVLRPVSKREERLAIKAATARLLSENPGEDVRFRVIGAELRIEKPAKRSAVPPRLIQVFMIDVSLSRIFDPATQL